MFKKLKPALRAFKHDKPGMRFQHLHQHWSQEAKGPLLRGVAVVLGLVLMVGGILLGLVPGVPGIFLGVMGLALIAVQFRWAAGACDRTEIWLRTIFKPHRHRTAHPK